MAIELYQKMVEKVIKELVKNRIHFFLTKGSQKTGQIYEKLLKNSKTYGKQMLKKLGFKSSQNCGKCQKRWLKIVKNLIEKVVTNCRHQSVH